MNKTKLSILSILSVLALGAVSFGAPKEPVAVSAYQNNDASTYYNSIDKYDSGSTLTSKLNTLNNQKRRKLISYNSLFNYFDETDPPSGYGKVTAFYSGKSISSGITREHVWPYSRLYLNGTDSSGKRTDEGKNEIEQDLQMIRPCYSGDNEGRGNAFFTMPDGQGWDPGSLGVESYRGDSARIIFYCAIADLNLTLVDKDYDSKDNHTMGKLSTLLKWNLQYPVKSREKTRNEAVESLQGHRNPFIDHPEYACRIWGNYNYETRLICGSHGVDGDVVIKHNNTSVEEYDLQVDDNASFTVSYGTSGTRTYEWMFSNIYGTEMLTDVASIVSSSTTNVTIKGDKIGETYLKCLVKTNTPSGGVEQVWKAIRINVMPKVDLVSLQLTSFPEKEDYYVGDIFNPKGLKVSATFSDGSITDVTDRLAFDDVTLDTPGSKKITATYTYKGTSKSIFFYVTVKNREDPTPTPTPLPTGGGCGGSIATSTILLSSLSITGVILISLCKKKHKKSNK